MVVLAELQVEAELLVEASRPPDEVDSIVFDVVDVLHRHYREVFEDVEYLDWWDRMPLVLYT